MPSNTNIILEKMKIRLRILVWVMLGCWMQAYGQTTEPTRFVHANRDRAAVERLYRTVFVPNDAVREDWTTTGNCDPGTLSKATLAARLKEINYFRTMAGVRPVTFDPEFNRKAQAAAFMMRQNGTLNHFPPQTWKCFSWDGALGAANSNLGLGCNLMGHILDQGESNRECGHRMWMLWSGAKTFGYGATDQTNAVYVIAKAAVYPSLPEYVAWPPAGFVPWEIMDGRWSFSVPGDNVDYEKATVQLSLKGQPIPLNYTKVGSTGDGGVAFEMANFSALEGQMIDQTIKVKVQHVVVDGKTRDYEYEVTLFVAREIIPYVPPKEIPKPVEVPEDTSKVAFADRKVKTLADLEVGRELSVLMFTQLKSKAVADLVYNVDFTQLATQMANLRKAKNPNPTELNQWAARKIKTQLAQAAGIDEAKALTAPSPYFLYLEATQLFPLDGAKTYQEVATELVAKLIAIPNLRSFVQQHKGIRQCGIGLSVKPVERNGQTYAGVYATVVIAPEKLGV
jgi:hypothetical protein